VSEVSDDAAALVALLRLSSHGLTWPQIAAEVAEAGGALPVWRRYAVEPPALFDLREDPLVQATADLQRWRGQGITVLTVVDAAYPAQLREIHEMPPILFCRGNLVAAERGVSVVGSRSADENALSFAREVTRGLVARELAVLSGLARGVDTAAHTEALAAGGRTVAFLGTGILGSYPAENRALQERIARDGLLVSQFWPEAPPQKHTFPMRNAVMSGYGRATVVVTAGETSGTRTQARFAVEHGRPVILHASVARGTSWGRALTSRPGVYVASNPDDALAVVDDVTRPLSDTLDGLLAPLL
jgi:DNA processing protein